MTNLASWPARHPLFALAIGVVAIALSILAVTRVHPDPSLESMMTRDDSAVKAAVRVLNEFPAAEELLVLASLPDSTKAPDTQPLLAFAQRLDQAVKNSREAQSLCDAVNYQAGAQIMDYFKEVLVPNGLYYLDRPSFDAARQRLTRKEMQQQFERNQAMLAMPGPAASAMAKVYIKDPLRHNEFEMDRLMGGRPFKT
jgi:predicted RND superfamily exporter protein